MNIEEAKEVLQQMQSNAFAKVRSLTNANKGLADAEKTDIEWVICKEAEKIEKFLQQHGF